MASEIGTHVPTRTTLTPPLTPAVTLAERALHRAERMGLRHADRDIRTLLVSCDCASAYRRALATLVLACRWYTLSLDPCTRAEYAAREHCYQAAYDAACALEDK